MNKIKMIELLSKVKTAGICDALWRIVDLWKNYSISRLTKKHALVSMKYAKYFSKDDYDSKVKFCGILFQSYERKDFNYQDIETMRKIFVDMTGEPFMTFQSIIDYAYTEVNMWEFIPKDCFDNDDEQRGE